MDLILIFFRNSVGLMQGEVLSPILFSLYVNHFESEYLKSNCKSFDYGELNIFLLMYGDDMIISQSVEGLQNELNTLSNCARSWGLKVNIKKTKVVFRKNLRLYDYEKFHIDDSLIEIVNTFNYLGLHLNYNGKYRVAEKQLAEQGRKASFALSKQIKDMYLNVESTIFWFDTYISSILNYASEVWGMDKGVNI